MTGWDKGVGRTVNAEGVGTLEARMLKACTGRIEVSYLELEGCFLAVLLEEAGPDKPEGTMCPLIRASGQTIVEAAWQLELAYQRLISR